MAAVRQDTSPIHLGHTRPQHHDGETESSRQSPRQPRLPILPPYTFHLAFPSATQPRPLVLHSATKHYSTVPTASLTRPSLFQPHISTNINTLLPYSSLSTPNKFSLSHHPLQPLVPSPQTHPALSRSLAPPSSINLTGTRV